MKTYKDLMEEKARLELILNSKRLLIKKEIKEIKEEFVPITHAISNLFSRSEQNPIVNAGINLTTDLVFNKFLLARAGWLTKLVVPYLVKNYSSHLIKKNLNKDLNKYRNRHEGNFFQKLSERLKKDS